MSETDVQTTESQEVDTDNLDTFADDFFGRKPAAPAPTKAPVEQEVATDEVEDTEAQTTDDQVADEPEAPVEPKKKQTAEDRIKELVKQRNDAERLADAKVEALRKEFEDKLAKLTPAPAAAPKAAEPDPLDTKADGTPKYELGEFDPQYIRDLTRFTLETERAQAAVKADEDRKVQAETTAREALATDWNAKVEASKAEYPDFIEKGQELIDKFSSLPNDYAGYLSTVLMSMDKGPDVLYYLSNHPDEAMTIVNSGAQRATLALGRIEAKFLEADAQKQAAKPKISKAPPPPAQRTRGTNGAFISVAPDTDNLDDFETAFFAKK